jgi:predicted metal-binding membrane protein
LLAFRVGTFAQMHWLGFFGLVLLGWTALFAMAVPAELRELENIYGAGLIAALCGVTTGVAGLWASVAMWALMACAMMAPTALPAFAVYDQLGSATQTAFWHLVAGYFAVWLGFSVLAGLAQSALFATGLIGELGQSRSKALSALLLASAGAYQFSALKDACVSRCRAPLTFFMQHWDEGPWRNGLRLGLDCLGCCWALMLLAFVGGTMNLGFMGLAMLLMTLEKLPDIGRHLTRPLGAILLLAAGATLALNI